MAHLHYHGHATFTLTTDDDTGILIDPFFDDSPVADMSADEVQDIDFIFVTHGHQDHIDDAMPIARRTGATLVGAFEIVSFFESRGFKDVHPMGPGGSWEFPFGRVKMTPAIHGSAVHTGEGGPALSTTPGGYLFDSGEGQRVYHAGDTALTMDMQLLKGQVDIALLPIGDNFTMGPADAARAVDFIEPKVVIPMHYDTWGFIEVDVNEFRTAVDSSVEVVVLGDGDRLYSF